MVDRGKDRIERGYRRGDKREGTESRKQIGEYKIQEKQGWKNKR